MELRLSCTIPLKWRIENFCRTLKWYLWWFLTYSYLHNFTLKNPRSKPHMGKLKVTQHHAINSYPFNFKSSGWHSQGDMRNLGISAISILVSYTLNIYFFPFQSYEAQPWGPSALGCLSLVVLAVAIICLLCCCRQTSHPKSEWDGAESGACFNIKTVFQA